MEIKVIRNPRSFRLRKWYVQIEQDGQVYDTRFLFGGLFFKRRLLRKIERMFEMRKRAQEVINGFHI